MCSRFKHSLKLLLLCSSFLAGTENVIAVETPDAGNILRDIGDKFKRFPEPNNQDAPVVIVEEGEAREGQQELIVPVKRIVVKGVTLLHEQEILSLVTPDFGKSLTIGELTNVARRITNRYAEYGFLAQAILPPQEIRNGLVTIEVIEAKLGSVEVKTGPGVRFSKKSAEAVITTAQPKGEFIRIKDLERGLLLLRQLDGIDASSLIKPGVRKGAVDTVVELKPVPLVSGSAGFDNFGTVSTGEYRWMGTLDLHSPFGSGDRVSVKALYSEGIRYGRASYFYPLSPKGVVAGLSVNGLTYDLGRKFSLLESTGSSFDIGTSLAMPLVLKRRSNLYGQIGYDYRVFRDRILGHLIGDRRLNSGSAMLTGSWFDDLYGGGYTTAGMTIGFGRLDLSRVRELEILDYFGPYTDGHYAKLNFSISRMQYFFDDLTTLSLSMAGQFASTNLDSSEKMTLGGLYAVRAYPAGEAPGDEGLLLVAELRRKFTPGLQGFVFYDYGRIRQFKNTWPGWSEMDGASNVYSLDAIGGGALVTPIENLKLKGTVAWRLKHNPAADAQGMDHDGTFRDPRFWIEAAYQF